MESPLSGFPAALRVLRKRRGLSQREWAKKAGVSPSNLSQYELGKSDPGVKTLDRLLVAADSDLAELDEILHRQRHEPPEAPMMTAHAARQLLGELQGRIADPEWGVLADLARMLARERKGENQGGGGEPPPDGEP